tara:strand:- start:1760 stop:2713 length:954 start_codon:yes stop_codon:yes gene_type:complete
MYIHRNFTHPSGISPVKQEKVEEEEVEEKKEKKKKAFDYSKKQDYSGTTPTSEAITHFVTPQNNLELGLEFAAGGVGVGLGKGVSKLAKTKLGSKLVNKVPWLKSLTKPITKGSKGTKGTKKTDFDFSKKHDYSGGKPKGGVDGGFSDDAIKKMNANIDRYGQPDPTLYGKPKTKLEFNRVVQESTEGVGAMGRNMDNAGITIKNLDPKKSIKKIGVSDSGQEIYEVTYPNGEKLKFWESTGSANKPVVLSKKNAHLNAENSKGFFGVFPGNMDGSNVGFSKSWYIKADGWERGYGSEIVEDTGIWLKSLKESGILK